MNKTLLVAVCCNVLLLNTSGQAEERHYLKESPKKAKVEKEEKAEEPARETAPEKPVIGVAAESTPVELEPAADLPEPLAIMDKDNKPMAVILPEGKVVFEPGVMPDEVIIYLSGLVQQRDQIIVADRKFAAQIIRRNQQLQLDVRRCLQYLTAAASVFATKK